MTCQRQFAQRQPFSSTNLQHGMQRQTASVPSRATPKSSRRQTKRCQSAAALDVREVINNLKQQAQKQKTAAVLGALGAVASGLAFAGEHSSFISPQFAYSRGRMYSQLACLIDCRTWAGSRHGQDWNVLAWQLSGELSQAYTSCHVVWDDDSMLWHCSMHLLALCEQAACPTCI